MASFNSILQKLLEKSDLSDKEAAFALGEIVDGRVNNAQTAAFLTALKVKGETVEEIVACARTMKARAVPIHCAANNLTDTAGTGGDGKGTFNVSTCAAIIAAGAGAAIAKHGNRSVSGKSGSIDALEKLGIAIPTSPQAAEAQLEMAGITFVFAQLFHPAMKNVAQARKELGFKTIFNLLGPLTNPANARRQLIGAYGMDALTKIAEAAKRLGTEKALIVTSDTDEISISAETNACEIANGEARQYTLKPEEFYIKRAPLNAIAAMDSAESAEIILGVLNGNSGPARDVAILNASAALYVAGRAESIKKGIRLAEESVDSGKAKAKLELLRESNGHT